MDPREEELNRRFEKKARQKGIQFESREQSPPPPEDKPLRKTSRTPTAVIVLVLILSGIATLFYFSREKDRQEDPQKLTDGEEVQSLASTATAPETPTIDAALLEELQALKERTIELEGRIGESQDNDAKLAAVADRMGENVFLVIWTGFADGQPVSIPMATAWAVGPNTLATNSHVSEPLKMLLERGLYDKGDEVIQIRNPAVYAVANRNPDKRLRVISAETHPRYGEYIANIEGRKPAIFGTYDVGLLEIDTTLDEWFQIADEEELQKVDSGYPVAILGFPMENVAGGGNNPNNPVAILQNGIVTATTDYYLSNAGHKDRVFIQHNVGTSGGSSGSPIFNTEGDVIGIHSAGNYVFGFSDQAGPRRISAGVNINYGMRIDQLREIFPDYPQD